KALESPFQPLLGYGNVPVYLPVKFVVRLTNLHHLPRAEKDHSINGWEQRAAVLLGSTVPALDFLLATSPALWCPWLKSVLLLSLVAFQRKQSLFLYKLANHYTKFHLHHFG